MQTTARARANQAKEALFGTKQVTDRRLLKTIRSSLMVHHYPSIQAFVKAIKRGDVPDDLVSPGWVASQAGVTRQAVHQAIQDGRIDAWKVEGGYVFLRSDSSREFGLT